MGFSSWFSREPNCSFCRKPTKDCGRLFFGPNSVSICRTCAEACLTAFHKDAACSFCKKNYQECGPLVQGPFMVLVCQECAKTCLDIIQQELERRKEADKGKQGPEPVFSKSLAQGIIEKRHF